MLEWDRAIPVNRGFRGYDTVADLERYFAYEDAQMEFCDICKFKEVEP